MCECEKVIARLDALTLRVAAAEGTAKAILAANLKLVRIASQNDEALRIANEQLLCVLASGAATARSTPKAPQ